MWRVKAKAPNPPLGAASPKVRRNARTCPVHHIKIAKERSFFPKETAQRLAVDKLYSGKAGLEAVQRIGDALGRSPAVLPSTSSGTTLVAGQQEKWRFS